MVKQYGPPSPGWSSFLGNHAPDIAAIDLFIAPTIGFDLLYVLVIIRLERRKLVWINVTRHPTAEWIARQVTGAFPWAAAPRYLIRRGGNGGAQSAIDVKSLHAKIGELTLENEAGRLAQAECENGVHSRRWCRGEDVC